MTENIVNLLKNFNFTESESKVYIALLQNGPRLGYEISKFSGVPRSKVYNVLAAMLNKGFVAVSHSDKASLYKAEPVEHLLGLLKNSADEALNALEQELTHFDEARDDERIWHLNGYDTIINKCIQMVENAKTEVLMQIWVDDLDERLEKILTKKQSEFGRVLIVLYDSKEVYKTQLPSFYSHGFEDLKISDTGGRWITLTVDSKEMFYASVRSTKVAEGIYTKNASMVFFGNEYVKHDAYCLRLIKAMGEEAVKHIFGNDMEGIRDIFNMRE